MTHSFSEKNYLAANSDVADAVNRKEFVSGFARWLAFGKDEGRPLSLSKSSTSKIPNGLLHHIKEDKFLTVAPSNQNIIDIFQGEWSSKMPFDSQLISKPGHADLFNDPRVMWADQELGPIKGMRIVELGPLEGAHSCMLEKLEALSIQSIESNTRAFLKCLCVKEVFKLQRVNFLLGDFLPYLDDLIKTDLIFASGVLYHMVDPLRLLNLICSKTDRIFIWTHYFDPAIISKRADRHFFSNLEKINDSDFTGSRRLYPNTALSWNGFSGGAHPYAIWLDRGSLLSFINKMNFEVKINFDDPNHPNGPALAICATHRSSTLQ